MGFKWKNIRGIIECFKYISTVIDIQYYNK